MSIHMLLQNNFFIVKWGFKNNIHIIDDRPFTINGTTIIPIRGRHYKLPVLGYRFGDIAYCTDMNHIPDEEFNKLQGLKHFIINCVRRGHHISHFTLESAISIAERVGFNSNTHFSEYFKQVEGVPPMEFRKRMKNI